MTLFKRRAVRRALEKLAKDRNSAQIAEVIKDKGILGWSSPNNCPIAMYLKKVTGVKTVSVTRLDVRDGWKKPITMPRSAVTFVRAFDRGDYPELEVDRVTRYRITWGSAP